MEEVSHVQASAPEPETRHEPHEHAHKRVIVGVAATVIVFVVGGIVWALWGPAIERACFGDDACTIEQGTTSDGVETFSTPDEYQF